MPHADNALLHLARALERLRRADHLPIHITPTFERMVAAATAQARFPVSAAAGLLQCQAIASLLLKLAPARPKTLLAPMLTNTVTPTMMQAGTKINVIPSGAEASLDCRMLPSYRPADAMREILDITGPGVQLEWICQSQKENAMDELVELWEIPLAQEKYMIAGWRQWADAGAASSGLPEYLIRHIGATKIGQIKPDGFYLFQIPGTHQFLRPEVRLDQGYRKEMSSNRNELFYWGNERKGLFVFLGQEPHLNAERYAEAFLYAVKTLGVKRVAAVGGVYSEVPYDKDREVSCIYSLPRMKAELAKYAVKFSDYAGGVSISTYIADKAEPKGIEYLSLFASVPAYDFSQLTTPIQGVGVENDFKAWYDLMKRLNHMFGLKVDLAELAQQSSELASAMEARLKELEGKVPDLREYMARLSASFEEMPFIPLDDVWERELGDLL